MATTRRKKIDPFAVETETNETTETTNETEETPVAVEPTVNTENGEIEWSLTIKFGSGYDAPWLVGRFANLDAVEDVLENRADQLKTVMEKVGRVGRFAGSQMPSGGSNSGGQGANTGNGRPAHQQAPGGETRQCKHGEMVFKTGSKNGRVWKGFFCPTPRNTPDQCSPEFLN